MDLQNRRMLEVAAGGGGTISGITTNPNIYFRFFDAGTDFSQIQYSQRGDILRIVHPDYPPFFILREAEITGVGRFRIHPWASSATFSDAEVWSQQRDKNSTKPMQFETN